MSLVHDALFAAGAARRLARLRTEADAKRRRRAHTAPAKRTPPNLDDFTAPLSGAGQNYQALLWNPGATSWVACVIYGPDDHEVQTIRDQLLAAGVDIFKWGATEAPPDDLV